MDTILLAAFIIGCHCHILRLKCTYFADFSVKAENHLLEGSKIQEIEGASLNECKGQCVLNQQCKSINFRKDGSGICWLNRKSSIDVMDRINLTKSEKWDFHSTNYSVREVWSSFLILNELVIFSIPTVKIFVNTDEEKEYHCI